MSISTRELLPTKINLIRLRRLLVAIRRIRKILDEKREVILLYLRQIIDEFEAQQKIVSENLTTPSTLKIDIRETLSFGVRVPSLSLFTETIAKPTYGLAFTSPKLDLAYTKLNSIIKSLLRLIELEVTVYKLIEELRKTQRLINAIDYVILPEYESAVKYIQMVLDQRLREEFVRLKLLKRKFERKRMT